MRRSRSTAVSCIAFLFAVAGAACVDGTTPDCSDAAAHCGPDYDAYPPDDGGASDSAPTDSATDSNDATDAPTDTAPPRDSAPDAPSEAASDGGAG